MPPTLLASIGLGLRGLVREPWLLAAAVGVALLRRAAVWPAAVVAWTILARAALLSAMRHPLQPGAPLSGALSVLGAPRFAALVLGLWLAGLAVGAALRVAFLSGALPTLGGALAGAPGPRFAAGVAYGLPRVLGAAALGLVLDAAGAGFGATLALAALRISAHAVEAGGSPLLAAAVALALTLAVAVPVALSAVADGGVARAALREEGPARAVASAGGRFLARPGTFLLAALAFGVAGSLAPAMVQASGGVLTGFVQGRPILAVGPELMLALLGTCIAAAIDLWWLGTIAALTCAEVR